MDRMRSLENRDVLASDEPSDVGRRPPFGGNLITLEQFPSHGPVVGCPCARGACFRIVVRKLKLSARRALSRMTVRSIAVGNCSLSTLGRLPRLPRAIDPAGKDVINVARTVQAFLADQVDRVHQVGKPGQSDPVGLDRHED